MAIVVFPKEEGSRFGVACLGTRLLIGAITPEKALNLRDLDGTTCADVARSNWLDPRLIGADPRRFAQIGAFVELHVEQGLGLAGAGPPGGHWRLDPGAWALASERVTGQGNHAGTTLMTGRRDPMVAATQMVVAIRDIARAQPHARATVGRLEPVPGGTNVIASAVDFWLDVRLPDDAVTAALIQRIYDIGLELAAAEGCEVTLNQESLSPTVTFDAQLTWRLQASLASAPVLDTGAGHDAGVLAVHVPSAMIFVPNPSGISHSPRGTCRGRKRRDREVAPADALAGKLV